MVVGFLFLVSFSLVLTKKPGLGFTTYITNKLKKQRWRWTILGVLGYGEKYELV